MLHKPDISSVIDKLQSFDFAKQFPEGKVFVNERSVARLPVRSTGKSWSLWSLDPLDNASRTKSKPTRGRAVGSPVILLSVGFCVLLGIVVMTYLLAERSRTYFDSAIATRDQRTAAVKLRNALLAAESSHRGFIFSGNEVYLAPFDTAQNQALRWLELLEGTTGANPEAKPLIERLAILSTEMRSDMATLIALKRERRDEEVLALFRTNRGKALMDEANIFFSGLILAADDRLTEGVGEQRANAAWLRLATIVGGLVIVAVVGLATASVLSQARELASAAPADADPTAGAAAGAAASGPAGAPAAAPAAAPANEINALAIVWGLIKSWVAGLFGKRA